MTKGQETRIHILKESRRLFTMHGFKRSSISKIIAATGVKKGNLYYHFTSKEELGLAVLTDARDEFLFILKKSLSGETAKDRILHSCNVIMDLMQQTNFVGGCLFGNTALEMTDSDYRFAEIIQDVFSQWIGMIESELDADFSSKKSGCTADTLSAADLALTIVAILEGGIMLSRVYRDQNQLKVCIDAIEQILENRI